MQKGRSQAADDGRHVGLVVDDKEAVRRSLADAGVEVLPGPFPDFRDPWGNRIEDRFGLSWQIVPTLMFKLMADPDRQKAKRVTDAMLETVKFDIATLQAAADGKPT